MSVTGAWQEHKEKLTEADNPEQTAEAVEPILEAIAAEALNIEDAEVEFDSTLDGWLKQLAEKSGFTKTKLREKARELAMDHAKDTEEFDEPPFDLLLESELEVVTVYRSTDAHTDTVYQWVIDGETVTTSGGEQMSWNQMREIYFDETGDLPAKPMKKENEEWKRLIADLLDERGRVKKNVGPRSQTVETLGEHIATHTAYPELYRALDRGGVWQPEEAVGEWVGVPTKPVKEICDQGEITTRALQVELDARDQLVAHARDEHVNSEKIMRERVRVWRISTGLATPKQREPPMAEEASGSEEVGADD